MLLQDDRGFSPSAIEIRAKVSASSKTWNGEYQIFPEETHK